MKSIQAGLLLLILSGAGCVSKSTANMRARAAYVAGQQQAVSAQASATTVWVIGNVGTPVIPWTEDLTLARALLQADYLGQRDPRELVIQRNGQPPTHVSAQQLLNGFDMPLAAGDRIEIRP